MTLNHIEIAKDVAVMGGLVFIIGVIIHVHVVPIYLTTGSLSTTDSRILTVGVTAAATVFTSLVISRIKTGFLRSLEDRFQSIPENPHFIQDPNVPGDDHYQEHIRVLEREWRSMLAIETFLERIKNYRVFLAYLMSALITTSIVTSLAPTSSTKTISYNSRIPDTTIGLYTPAGNRSVYGICLAPCNETNTYDTFRWSLPNGSWIYVTYDGLSPASYMTQVSNGINNVNPDDYVYADSGVAVERTAMGAPTTLFSGDAYGNISSRYGQALTSLTQCVPVMTSNPVRCQSSGNVTVTSDSTLTTTSGNVTFISNITSNYTSKNAALSAGFWNVAGYSIQRTVSRNFTRDSAMASNMWAYAPPSDNNNPENVGIAVIGIGAVNDPKGATTFANNLAGDINDPNNKTGLSGGDHYVVTCVVDPRNAFDYRMVTLDLRALGQEGKRSNYAQYLSGAEACTPLEPTISNKMFAVAGTAAFLLVTEATGEDGNIATLTRLAGSFRQAPYAFADSTNALEDVLGLVSALAVSRTPFSGEGIPAAQADQGQGIINATAVIEVTRLGSSSASTLWLLIPPVASLTALATLFVMGIRRQWAPGGVWFSGTDDQRLKRYVGESVFELIMLGIAASKNAEYKKVEIESSDALSIYSPSLVAGSGRSARSSLVEHNPPQKGPEAY
ncbi:hypothetical protein F5Y16DRAFT_415845 [Xylariaceae sp. FL0255]|nr:hypothetical protein F5Y16DRAFT_415845 [Xylariaceae sp. FL0255]